MSENSTIKKSLTALAREAIAKDGGDMAAVAGMLGTENLTADEWRERLHQDLEKAFWRGWREGR